MSPLLPAVLHTISLQSSFSSRSCGTLDTVEIKFWAVLLWICVHVHKCFISSLSLTDDQMSSAVHTALTVVMVLAQGHLVFVKRCVTTPLYFRPKADSCLRRAVFSLAYLSRQRSHLRLTCVHIQPCCTAVCHGFICVAVRKHSSHICTNVCALGYCTVVCTR